MHRTMNLPVPPLIWHWDVAGDQAVIKTPESITYYGGKSQQVREEYPCQGKSKAHALREIITGKDRVIVMGHRIAGCGQLRFCGGYLPDRPDIGQKGSHCIERGLRPLYSRWWSCLRTIRI